MHDLNGLANAMADRFFKERDRELLENLKKEVAGEDARDALAAACGITDAAVLDSLVASGIGPDTIATVSLIPLVVVAWADREMEPQERVLNRWPKHPADTLDWAIRSPMSSAAFCQSLNRRSVRPVTMFVCCLPLLHEA
jgi:hypothetical protein